jgi:tetratricopeptide (TPR) repeat protein
MKIPIKILSLSDQKRVSSLVLISLTLWILLPAEGLLQESARSFHEWIEEGDRHSQLRAEGAEGSRADPKEIDLAISSYREALALAPESLAVRWRLMRALYFKGEYTTENNEERKRIFDEGKRIGEAALQQIRKEASLRSGMPMEKAGPIELAPLFKETPDIVDTFFWSAVNWGSWALAFGKLQAARQGAANQIRDLATAVTLIDPNYQEGGGLRILGRLHHQTPSIPFITGWASVKEGVNFLRRAREIGPNDFLNRLFLAEALWDLNRGTRDEALRIAEELARDTPRSAFLVEDRKAQEQAEGDLNRWKKK